MTEAEWLTTADVQLMLCADRYLPLTEKFSDRKLRLLACACCRGIWPQLTDFRSRRAVEVAERYADGLAISVDIADAGISAMHEPMYGGFDNDHWRSYEEELAWSVTLMLPHVVRHLRRWFSGVSTKLKAEQADLLRHIISPYRPAWSRTCQKCGGYGKTDLPDPASGRTTGEWFGSCSQCKGDGHLPRPRPDLPREVVELAQVCYEGAGQTECNHRFPDDSGGWLTDVSDGCPQCNNTGFVGGSQPLAPLADALDTIGEVEAAEHFRASNWCPKGCHWLDAIRTITEEADAVRSVQPAVSQRVQPGDIRMALP